jgi:hypothetical protein
MSDLYETDLACYRCSASSWEYLETIEGNKPEDVVGCMFCGVRMRVKAAAVPVAASRQIDTAEFRFQYGRFKGMTLAEADAEPNGRRYLEVMRDRNDKLKPRIEEYLSSAAPSA